MKENLTREQLNNMDKDILISLFLGMQEQLTKQTDAIEKLMEQIRIMNTRKFSRSSEAGLVDDNQLNMFDDILNEAEAISDPSLKEPEMDVVIIPEHKRKKRKGKRAEDLSKFPIVVVEHDISSDELEKEFPDGFSRLPDEIYNKLELIPVHFEVHEHHIAVYKGRNGKIVKAAHPKEMLNNSIATPSLVAGIINAKYTNSVPLYRQEQEYARNDVNISRQNMANWVIRVSERYLSLMYDRFRKEITEVPVLHADETPVYVTKDGREGMHKNYMWVYHTGSMCKSNQIVMYEYQKTRKADGPREFLKAFNGYLVCDGYQVYHSLEKEQDKSFSVAGCWVHARRPFAEVVKSLGEEKAVGTLAYEGLIQIQNILNTDKKLRNLTDAERKRKRKALLKPMIDNFFEWARKSIDSVGKSSATGKGIQYCLNQEKYLRTFLEDSRIPLDNNLAERSIRPFCVGKKNWKLIDTVNGAKASAILYSIVETAKANELNIYEYFKYLLSEIPLHMDETDTEFLEDLLPWSKKLPEICRKKRNEQ